MRSQYNINNSDFGNFLPAMRCVPIDGDRVLMVRCSPRSKNPAKRGLWGFPGGQIELLPKGQGFAETPAFTLLRETGDETGYEVREASTPILVENRRIRDGAHAGKIMLTYAAIGRGLHVVSTKIDPENDALAWFPLESVSTMKVTPVTQLIVAALPELQTRAVTRLAA